MKQNFLEFITTGSWSGNFLMLLLFILSIIAVYVFVERYVLLRTTKKGIKDFTRQMQNSIQEKEYQKSIDLLHKNDSVAAIVLRKSLHAIGKKEISINEANLVIDTIGNNEVSLLEKGFSTLASIAGGAPMIGFLGTVIGMVQAFYEMSAEKFEVVSLSQGIYTAMFTTVGGLTVGIIAYFGYNILVSRLKRITSQLEAVKIDYIELRNYL